jgi:hypothetical protein
VAELRRLVGKGDSDELIASTLKRTVRAIAVKRAKLGLTVRTLGGVSNVQSLATHTLVRELRRRGFEIPYGDYLGCDGPTTG